MSKEVFCRESGTQVFIELFCSRKDLINWAPIYQAWALFFTVVYLKLILFLIGQTPLMLGNAHARGSDHR